MIEPQSDRPRRDCSDFSYGECEEAMTRLDDYMDRELSPDDRNELEKHLKLCDACTEEFGLRSQAQEVLRAKLCCEKCPDKLRASISAALHEEDTGV